MLNMDAHYLITGGTGFLGRHLIQRLYMDGYLLRALARSESRLLELKQRFPEIETVPGDIADFCVCQEAMQEVDGVFHLAALKHVTESQLHTKRCVETNVLGTLNLLRASTIFKPAFVLGISSDKAASVTGVYGATKLLQEALFIEFERLNRHTKYRTVRYGNVFHSTGSVLCKWKAQIETGEAVTITDKDATRFFWTVQEAVDLIFACLQTAENAIPFVTPMRAVRLGDLLDAAIQVYSRHPPVDMFGDALVRVLVTGLNPGENKHERLSETGVSSESADRFTYEELLAICRNEADA